MHKQDLVAWLEDFFVAMHASSWGPELDLDGFDLLELMRWEIYLTSLRAQAGTGLPEKNVGKRLFSRFRLNMHEHREAQKGKRLTPRSAPLTSADVVFWPCEPTHLKSQIPVMAAVKQQGHSAVMITSKPRMFELAEAAGVTTIYAPGIWPQIATAKRTGGLHAKRITQLPTDILSDLPPFPRLAQLFSAIRHAILQTIPLTYVFSEISRSILSKLKPRAIVVGNDLTLEGRTACHHSGREGVATACLQHGSISLNPYGKHRIADLSIMYGEHARDQLVNEGLSPDKVIACGAPYLDKRVPQSGEINSALAQELGLDTKKKYVLFATSGPGIFHSEASHVALVEEMTKLSAELPDINVVAKLHRKDKPHYFEKAAEKIPGARLRFMPHGKEGIPNDIFTWLQGANAVITGGSTVAVEAMLLSVPVITVDLANELADVDFIKAGATLHCTNYDELKTNVQKQLSSPEDCSDSWDNAQTYLKRMFSELDGHASDRSASAIASLFSQ